MTIQGSIAALWLMAVVPAQALAASVTALADTGTFKPDEMAVDRVTGDIYLTGHADGSSSLSIVRVVPGSLPLFIYTDLPASNSGSLTSTNGFTIDGSSRLWWNNANAGPGFLTEVSRAAANGGFSIFRSSPTDDLDSLSWSGTSVFAAHYAGSLYEATVTSNIVLLNPLGVYRETSHLAIVGDGPYLYVLDMYGAYRRNPDGSVTELALQSGFRLNGSRAAVGGGFLYALEKDGTGFWQIPTSGGTPTRISDPAFGHLQSVGYFQGAVYLADDGDTHGRIWRVESALVVPAGPKGPAGPAGDTGPRGPPGPSGPAGATGAAGADGQSVRAVALAPTDARCAGAGGYEVLQHDPVTGIDAAVGVVCNGLQGAQGARGPAGPQGPQGSPGPAFPGQVVEVVSGSPAPPGFTLIGVGKQKVKDGSNSWILVDVYRKD